MGWPSESWSQWCVPATGPPFPMPFLTHLQSNNSGWMPSHDLVSTCIHLHDVKFGSGTFEANKQDMPKWSRSQVICILYPTSFYLANLASSPAHSIQPGFPLWIPFGLSRPVNESSDREAAAWANMATAELSCTRLAPLALRSTPCWTMLDYSTVVSLKYWLDLIGFDYLYIIGFDWNMTRLVYPHQCDNGTPASRHGQVRLVLVRLQRGTKGTRWYKCLNILASSDIFSGHSGTVWYYSIL